jgi:teichoic acid transport system ATP-binding protein
LQSVSEAPAVAVEGVKVRYRTTFEKRPTLKEALIRLGNRQRVRREIEALKGISFTVEHGRILGIIGANGAGKSTLLRTIAGIIPPSEGRIRVQGHITTLLSLGVGFNPDLSGRDNVILGGLAAGLDWEVVHDRMDDIVAFSELGEAIDYPVRTYSSGMTGRLGFSVAVHLEPDIMLIDEALSAGDVAFKQKCLDKMQELYGKAGTILLVSHGMGTIRELATECLWLHEGNMCTLGEPDEVVEEYISFQKVRKTSAALEDV